MIIKNPTPESSFLANEKDMNIIIDKIFRNKRLQKLLYYTSRDALKQPDLTEEQILSLFGKNIKILPKLYVDNEVLNYLIISFDNFLPNATNPEFRNNLIEFDILCHMDAWALEDFQLRPYKIAAEIDSMFCQKHLTGIGELEFVSGQSIIQNNEFAGFCLQYRAIHGDEDKKPMPNPKDQEQFEKDFYEMIESDG